MKLLRIFKQTVNNQESEKKLYKFRGNPKSSLALGYDLWKNGFFYRLEYTVSFFWDLSRQKL